MVLLQGKGGNGWETLEIASSHIHKEVMLAGNTETKYVLCFGFKGKLGGMEWVERLCHGKGGNIEKQRSYGSPQGTD